jgi:hypothetical protein
MPAYLLARDCFARKIGPHWIVLNVSRDRYYCLQHEDLQSIGNRIEGWAGQRAGEPVPATQHRDVVDATLRSLLSAGIITNDPGLGKPFAEAPIGRHAEVLAMQGDMAVGATPLLRFLAACAWADWSLRRRSIAATLAGLRRRKDEPGEPKQEDLRRAARLVGVFNRLRPVYPRTYRCLFDALALLEFLARHELSPRIVFGVIADPFQAHCWLQLGTVLVNEDDERVRCFAPIMSA